MGSKSLLATLNTFQHRVQNLAVQNANLLSFEGGGFKGKKLHIFHFSPHTHPHWACQELACQGSRLPFQ